MLFMMKTDKWKLPVSQNTLTHFLRMEYSLKYALWDQIPVCRHLKEQLRKNYPKSNPTNKHTDTQT